jgi:hypothetical protein
MSFGSRPNMEAEKSNSISEIHTGGEPAELNGEANVGFSPAGPLGYWQKIGGIWKTATAVTALHLKMSSGNITSGVAQPPHLTGPTVPRRTLAGRPALVVLAAEMGQGMPRRLVARARMALSSFTNTDSCRAQSQIGLSTMICSA